MLQEIATRRNHADREVEIKANKVLDIRDCEGLGVVCVEGVVWITQSDDCHDIIVHAGKSFTLDRLGLVLVAAPVGPATITLRPAMADKPQRPRVSTAVADRIVA